MPSPNYDLRYLQAGVQLLEKYLLSDEIYWPIGIRQEKAGKHPYPSLTLGGLLFAQAKLQGRSLYQNRVEEIEHLNTQLGHIKNQWAVAWETKSGREFVSRLKLWRDFLAQYKDEPKENANRYSYEVGRRLMLDLLGEPKDPKQESQIELLATLDGYLRSVFIPGKFVWEQELAQGFSAETYWYLYGRLRL